MKTLIDRSQVITLQITDLNHSGEGVGKTEDSFTIFVPGALPGDVVSARVISVKKSYARALPVQIIKPSEKRINPLCVHHHICGGCVLQHLDYAEQLLFKHRQVVNALQRIGGFDISFDISNDGSGVKVLPVAGMDNPWYYRNKAQVPVAGVKSGDSSSCNGAALVAGFYEKRSHRVVDITECHIQHPENNRVITVVKNVLQALKITPYDEKNHLGIIRHIIARVSFSREEVTVVLVTKGRQLPHKGRLVAMLREQLPNLTGIIQNVNSQKGNTIQGRTDILIWGRPYITDSLAGLQFNISPRSFYQVNPWQTEKLYRQILHFAGLSGLSGLTGREMVFDLYCGIGTITLFLAARAGQVIGVEAEKEAVKDARRNAALNDIKNARFYAGKAEDVVPALVKEGLRPGLVIVDPPRKGCEESLLMTIISSAVPRIIYVSCNPATLARDLKILSEKGGYQPREVRPVDMFPHTSHVECVALINKMV